MRLRLASTLLLAATMLLAHATTALAASSQQIIRDAADGVIDGKYSAQELRAADRQINPQEREYYLWDEAYADALRRLANPDASPLPVVPVKDFDGDGKIEASDVQEAKKRTKALRDKVKKQNPDEFEDENDDAAGGDDGESAAAAARDDDGSGGSSWGLLAALFAIPAAMIGLGTWRMQRSRRAAATEAAGNETPASRKRRGRGKADADPGTSSSFAAGDDLQ